MAVIAAAGLYYIGFSRQYGEIRYLIPMDDGTGLFVRKGDGSPADWLVREDPKKDVLWAIPLSGTVWGQDDPDGISISQGKIAVQILQSDLSRRLEILDGENGKAIWQAEKDEILLLDEVRGRGEWLLTWRGSSGEMVARNWADGQVKWKVKVKEEAQRPFAFRNGDWLVVRRNPGEIALLNGTNGDSLPDLLAEEIFPIDEWLLYRTPSDSDRYHAMVLMNPQTVQQDTLQWYQTDSGALPLRLLGCGRQDAQLTWLLGQGQDTTFVEAMIPALTDQSIFMELGRGIIQNKGGSLPEQNWNAAFNPIVYSKPHIPLVLYRIPFAKSDGPGDHYGELVLLNTEKLEVAWRSKPLRNVYDYEIITMEGRHYLNGRGGTIAQFRTDVPELQRAVFVKGIPHLRPYMFLNNQIWLTVDKGWVVLNAETLELVMVTNKDFAMSNMVEEVRKEFGWDDKAKLPTQGQ